MFSGVEVSSTHCTKAFVNLLVTVTRDCNATAYKDGCNRELSTSWLQLIEEAHMGLLTRCPHTSDPQRHPILYRSPSTRFSVVVLVELEAFYCNGYTLSDLL